ncbi:MAG: undecaprenyl-diphosphate phosphatase [Candidatus Sericytochromatia bacterium]
MDIVQALILGVVEGITEFLPISSTGHMILASWLLQMQNTEFLKSFEIAIQLGAILAVVLLYYKRFLQGKEIYIRLALAFLPAAVIGFALHKIIKGLFSPTIVAINLILGGLILLVVNRDLETKEPAYEDVAQMSYKNALLIGLCQCVALIPGVSRAGATIIGGIYNGCDKKMATEFSFLLAIPTMLAATAYDLYKNHDFQSQQFAMLAIGFVMAFVSAVLAIKLFIELVVRYGFKGFAWYRIALGALVLVALLMGAPLQQEPDQKQPAVAPSAAGLAAVRVAAAIQSKPQSPATEALIH